MQTPRPFIDLSFALLAVLGWCELAKGSEGSDAACATARAQASASAAGAGFPYFIADGRAEPAEGDRREESLRLGIEMNVADLVRRGRITDRAEADCARFQAEAAAEGLAVGSRLKIEQRGLLARKAALDEALAAAGANLAERTRRLAAFHDTRLGVNSAAQEVAVLKQDLIDTNTRLKTLQIQVAQYPEAPGVPAEVLSKLAQASVDAFQAAAADRRGPAWDFTLGYGRMSTRYVADSGVRKVDGDPAYATVGLTWRPVVAFARDIPRDSVEKADRLGRDVAVWEVEKASLTEAYAAKVALATERLGQVRADLALVNDSRIPDTKEYAPLLQREERTLGVNVADWQARLEALGGAKPVAPAPAAKAAPAAKPATREFATLKNVVVTEGEAEALASGAFASKGTKIRARAEGGKGSQGVRTEFTYVGPTADMAPLASGTERRQLGVYMAAKNQCNMLYMMWRLPLKGGGAGTVVVQRKVNAGKATHEQCGNSGYQTVTPQHAEALPELLPGTKHTLEGVLKDGKLTVHVDGKVLWEGEIDVAGLDPVTGDIGWRSDNVKTEFTLARLGGSP